MKTAYTLLLCLVTAGCFSQHLANHIIIVRNGSKAIIDEHNVELIPAGYYSDIWTTYDSTGKYFVVTDFNRKKGIYELGNKEVFPCLYDDIRMWRNHGFVKKDTKWAVISSGLKTVTDFTFEEISHFDKEGRALAKQHSAWIQIDTNGSVVRAIPFDEVFSFNEVETYKKAGSNKKYGFVDKNYNIVIPFDYEDVGIAVKNREDIFPVKQAGRWGYVNSKNQVVVPFRYAYVSPVHNGFGWIRDHNFNISGLVDAGGTVLFDDSRYSDIEYAQERTLMYTVKGAVSGKQLKGYLDSASFKVIIQAQFDTCGSFHHGLAMVKKNGFAAVIDRSGKVILPYKYENIDRWGNYYVVRLHGKSGMIDNTGKIIVPLDYEEWAYSGLYASITKNSLKGILHHSGQVLVAPAYDNVSIISESVFLGIRGDKKFLVFLDGSEQRID